MTQESSAAGEHAIVGRAIGHYRITGFVSEGGMGAVYRAEHDLIGKAAAVKVLRPELSREPEMVQRFFNEAKAASAIRHPGIVEVFDFGHLDDGRGYIVMEFLDGETLGQRLSRVGRLSELEAATVTRGIAVALAAAHAKGIVHRDLKPDNVFLVPDAEMPSGERCKVLDFGIAKLSNRAPGDTSRTRTGTFMGTPLYMSPEQARGSGDLDHRADLYSLGCMLYEMVVGDPPFIAEGAGEIIALQIMGELTPPRARAPDVSVQLEAVILRLLAKDRAARYQSARELVDGLVPLMPGLTGRMSSVHGISMGPGTGSGLHAAAMPMPTPPPLSTPGTLSPAPEGQTWDPRPTTLGSSVGQSSIAPQRRSLGPVIAIGGVALAMAGLAILISQRGGEPSTGAAPIEPAAAAAPAPVAAATPPPAPEPPPPPAEVVVTLDTDPPGAAVTVDGAVASAPDGKVSLPRDEKAHKIALSAPGYATRTLVVRANRDQTLSVALAPAPTPPPEAAAATPPAPTTSKPTKPTKPTGKPAKKPSTGKRPPSGSPIEEEL